LDAGDPGEELAAVAPARAVAEAPRLEQRDASLGEACGEVPRRRHAGESPADHRDVGGRIAIEPGERLAGRRLVDPAGAVPGEPLALGRAALHRRLVSPRAHPARGLWPGRGAPGTLPAAWRSIRDPR